MKSFIYICNVNPGLISIEMGGTPPIDMFIFNVQYVYIYIYLLLYMHVCVCAGYSTSVFVFAKYMLLLETPVWMVSSPWQDFAVL